MKYNFCSRFFSFSLVVGLSCKTTNSSKLIALENLEKSLIGISVLNDILCWGL